MDLLGLVTGQLNNADILKMLGGSTKAEPDQIKKLATVGLPAILDQMSKNTADEAGMNSLFNALDKHPGDNIGDIASFLKGVDLKDGGKILQHVFAKEESKVEKNLAKETGLSAKQVTTIMSMLAPMVLAYLGSQKKKKKLDAKGVAALTSQLSKSANMGSSVLGMASMVGKMLQK